MSAYIDSAYVGYMLGTDVRDALTSSSSTTLTTFIQAASALVDVALANAGYTTPATANDTIKLATLGALLPLIHGARAGIEVPSKLEEIATGLWRGIGTGEIPIPNVTPDARSAVGGVEFSDSTDDEWEPVFVKGTLRDVY